MNWRAYKEREDEREALTADLQRGEREMQKSMRSLEGWSDRIMASILKPTKDEYSKLPRGRNVPDKIYSHFDSAPL